MHNTPPNSGTTLPPTVPERLSMLYRRRKVAPHKRRLLRYLVVNPDALTHQIAHEAQISYPPAAIAKLNVDLPSVGLRIERKSPGGRRSRECTWRIVKLPAA